jgi:hypothetical protein
MDRSARPPFTQRETSVPGGPFIRNHAAKGKKPHSAYSALSESRDAGLCDAGYHAVHSYGGNL